MRRSIVHADTALLTYAIREIVLVGQQFGKLGLDITWENIGDPVQKGERIEPWIRDVLADIIQRDESWAYCDTAGVPATREFLAAEVNKRGGARITPGDILFFNGLGDAVNKIYHLLCHESRVISPSPVYSTHASAEALHSGFEHMSFPLDPKRNWLPDLDDLRLAIKWNDSLAGICIINPDNPTGAVYPREALEGIVKIAREHDLFIICDEVYAHITYNGRRTLHISELIQDVPAIVLRGISKEYPWPGSRCGWIEILNRDKDANFHAYADSLLAAKRTEVCCTTMPQMTIPRVMGDARYPDHLRKRAGIYERRQNEAYEALRGIPGAIVNRPCGAFYFTVCFEDGALNNRQTLKIENAQVRQMVEGLVKNVRNDWRFVYYLMAATGICTVPLSGFACSRDGFRLTVLENDDAKRAWIFKTIAGAIRDYLGS